MSISTKQIRHIARLARVAVSEEEVARLATEMAGILDWIAMLDEVQLDTHSAASDTQDSDAQASGTRGAPLRADDTGTTPSPETLLRNAPAQAQTDEGTYFSVPKTVE